MCSPAGRHRGLPLRFLTLAVFLLLCCSLRESWSHAQLIQVGVGASATLLETQSLTEQLTSILPTAAAGALPAVLPLPAAHIHGRVWLPFALVDALELEFNVLSMPTLSLPLGDDQSLTMSLRHTLIGAALVQRLSLVFAHVAFGVGVVASDGQLLLRATDSLLSSELRERGLERSRWTDTGAQAFVELGLGLGPLRLYAAVKAYLPLALPLPFLPRRLGLLRLGPWGAGVGLALGF